MVTTRNRKSKANSSDGNTISRVEPHDLCCKCDEAVNSADAAICCELCSSWFHCECVGITDKVYAMLQRTPCPLIRTICEECAPTDKPNAVNTPKRTPHSKSTRQQQLKSRDCSKQLPTGSTPTDREKVANSVETEEPWVTNKPREKSTPKSNEKPAKEPVCVKEAKRTPRENCLMVFNVPEHVNPDPATRHKMDLTKFQGILNTLLCDEKEDTVEVKAVTRIGPYNHNETADCPKTRPMKVIFTNAQDPIKLLRQSRKLAGQDVSIRPDLDVEARIKMKAALAELRDRKSHGEINLVVRNFRVVKRKLPRLLPQPLLMQAGQSC